MNERIERTEAGIDSLRSRMDADARFRRAMSGYDPRDVQAYVENVKRIFAQQTKAAKQEQDDLLAQLPGPHHGGPDAAGRRHLISTTVSQISAL